MQALHRFFELLGMRIIELDDAPPEVIEPIRSDHPKYEEYSEFVLMNGNSGFAVPLYYDSNRGITTCRPGPEADDHRRFFSLDTEAEVKTAVHAIVNQAISAGVVGGEALINLAVETRALRNRLDDLDRKMNTLLSH